jgi:hypothetical protein
MREKVQFDTNVPVEVALLYADGRDVEGRFGDQVMYTLADDRVMFVPPIVRDRFVQLGVVAGELVTVCKREVKQGNRRSIQWQVERLEGSATGETSKATPAAPAPAPSQSQKPPQATTPAAPEVGSLLGPRGSQLRLALCSAIEAAQLAEEHAKARSYVVRFSADEITRMALTLLIDAQRGGRL